MKTRALGPFTIAALLFPILCAVAFLGGCNQEKNKTAENTYVVVTGEILPATDNATSVICSNSAGRKSTAETGCQDGKTIALTFHRTNPDIVMLMVTSDLSGLSAKNPGWHTSQDSLTCSGTNICREQCNLNLTYTPTADRPESTIYISYEYLVNGEKQPKKNRVSVVYMPSSSTVLSEETS